MPSADPGLRVSWRNGIIVRLQRAGGMAEYDLAVRGGLVATGFGTTRCDIGIRGGLVVALAEAITDVAAVVEAGGLLVLPGGVDSHCHIEKPARGGYTGRGAGGHRLVGGDASPRRGGDARRRGPGRARHRPIPGPRPV
jgi:hypothetical protein